MKRSYLLKIIALMLLISVAFVSFACNKNGKKDPDPEPTIGDYFVKGLNGALSSIDDLLANIDNNNIDFSIDVTIDSNKLDNPYILAIAAAINILSDNDSQNAASLLLQEGDDVLASLIYQDDKLFLNTDSMDVGAVINLFNIPNLIKHFAGSSYNGVDLGGVNLSALGETIEDFADLITELELFNELDDNTYNASENKITLTLSDTAIQIVALMLPDIIDGLIKGDAAVAPITMQQIVDKIVELSADDDYLYDYDIRSDDLVDILPDINLTLVFDLDANDKLEGISLGVVLGEKDIILDRVDSIEYNVTRQRRDSNGELSFDKNGNPRMETVARVVEKSLDENDEVITRTFKIEETIIDIDLGLKLSGGANVTKLTAAEMEEYTEKGLINAEVNGTVEFIEEDGTVKELNYRLIGDIAPLGFLYVDYDADTSEKKTSMLDDIDDIIANMGYAVFTLFDAETTYAQVVLNPEVTDSNNVYLKATFFNDGDKEFNHYFDIRELISSTMEYISNRGIEQTGVGETEEDKIDLDTVMDYITTYLSYVAISNADGALSISIDKDLFDNLVEDLEITDTVEIDDIVAALYGEDYVAVKISIKSVKLFMAPNASDIGAIADSTEYDYNLIFDFVESIIEYFN